MIQKRALLSLGVAASAIVLAMPPHNAPVQVFAASAPKTLTATVPAVVSSGRATKLGPRAAGETVRLTVALSPRDSAGLSSYVHSISDPASSQYGLALTQREANTRFNPDAAEEGRVSTWLRAGGLTVTHTYPNHVLLDVQGTVGQVEALLHVHLLRYSGAIAGKQRIFSAPDRNPTVAASASADVNSIVGLDTIPRFHKGYSNGATRTSAPYYPQNFANAYNVTSLWNAGFTGNGQHIGITLWTVPPSDASLNQFAAATGARVPTVANGRLHVTPIDGGTTSALSPDSGEAGMDIEYAGSMAPNAVVTYYEAPTDSQGYPTDTGLLDALNTAGTDVSNNRQITNSWGGCEAGSLSDPWTKAAESIFAANAATGHSYFFSSGDNGSWCDPYGNGTGVNPYPDYPASSPNVVSVGGTALNGSATSPGYPGESAWNYCGTCASGSPEGSGGGYSNIFGRPGWQSVGGLAANGKRGYPDIAADGDPNTGAYVCYGDNASCAWVGGTSLSSPLWAGMYADINSYLVSRSRRVAGSLAPALYRLAGGTPAYAPFHDVVSGTNGRYSAARGWDAVTGLGSPDAWNLARDIAGVGPAVAPTATSTPATPRQTSTPQPTATSTPRPTATSTGTGSGSGTSSGTCPQSQSGCISAMLQMLNADRAKYGVAPLTLNTTESNGTSGCVGAYGHSVHMAQLGSISHDQFPADICVGYMTAGENVGEAGYGNELTDMQTLDQMMMNEGVPNVGCQGSHACNIVNPGFKQVGIGLYQSGGMTWLTEDFIG